MTCIRLLAFGIFRFWLCLLPQQIIFRPFLFVSQNLKGLVELLGDAGPLLWITLIDIGVILQDHGPISILDFFGRRPVPNPQNGIVVFQCHAHSPPGDGNRVASGIIAVLPLAAVHHLSVFVI